MYFCLSNCFNSVHIIYDVGSKIITVRRKKNQNAIKHFRYMYFFHESILSSLKYRLALNNLKTRQQNYTKSWINGKQQIK